MALGICTRMCSRNWGLSAKMTLLKDRKADAESWWSKTLETRTIRALLTTLFFIHYFEPVSVVSSNLDEEQSSFY